MGGISPGIGSGGSLPAPPDSGSKVWKSVDGVPDWRDDETASPGSGEANVQSDYSETDDTSDAFIRNKPTDAEIGDTAFSNPPSDLTDDEKTAVREASDSGTLSDVSTDATITGDGTSGDPLSIANPFTDDDESQLDALPPLWAAGDHAVGDQVSWDGKVYRCLATRSSTNTGNPATDTTGWAEVGTGDGDGLASVSTDATITGDGTSGDPLSIANPFTDDDESQLDALPPLWSAGDHAVGDQVSWDGKVYRCLVVRTSSETDNPATDTTGWAETGTLSDVSTDATITGDGTSGSPLSVANPFTDDDESQLDALPPLWAAGTHAVGDSVAWAGRIYRCTVARTNSNTDNPATDTASWRDVGALQTAVEIRDELSSLTGTDRLDASAVKNLPQPGDGGLASVESDATLTGAGTSGDPLSIANPFTDDDESQLDALPPLWAAGDHAVGDQVSWDGKVYRCLATRSSTNTGNPATDTTGWAEVGTGDGDGLASVSTDATITGDGTSGDPLSIANPFTDDDESQLDALPPLWSAGDHAVGDQVSWDGKVYRCLVVRTSSETDNPATDTTGWAETGTLSDVSTDATITGDGTSGSPLSVANPFTDDDESQLDALPPLWAAGTHAVGDSVAWAGRIYRCTVARTNSNTDNPATDTASWRDVGALQTAVEIRDELSSLTGTDRLDASAVKNLPQPGDGGLASVESDATLTGAGTSGDPLSIANPFTDDDESQLDALPPLWSAGDHAVGDQVSWDGKVYRCLVVRTSSETDNPATDTTGWAETGTLSDVSTDATITGDGTSGSPLSVANPFTDDDESQLDALPPLWAAGTHAVGDSVAWAGRIYRCTVARTNSNTDNPATDTASWRDVGALQTAVEIRDELSSLTGTDRLDASAVKNLPQPGDGGLASVESDATLTGAGTSGDPLSIANPFTDDDESQLDALPPLWAAGDHAVGDQVSWDGKVYRCLATRSSTNTGNPATDTTGWAEVGTGDGDGLASVSTDATITGDGTSGDPLSIANPFTDDDESQLDALPPLWSAGDHAVGDQVSWDGKVYRCLATRQSTDTDNPATDTTGWAEVSTTDTVFAPVLLSDQEYGDADTPNTAIIPLRSGTTSTDPLVSPAVGFLVISVHGGDDSLGFEGNATWRLASDLRAADNGDPIHIAPTGAAFGSAIDLFTNVANEVRFRPPAGSTPYGIPGAETPVRITIWHVRASAPGDGGGLETVSTDATITGDGTSGDPLSVANPFTDDDESQLDALPPLWAADDHAVGDQVSWDGKVYRCLATRQSTDTDNPATDTTSWRDVGSLGTITTDTTLTGDGTTGDPLMVANPFTDDDETKLDGIETGATADQTASEIIGAIEGETGTDRLDFAALRDVPDSSTTAKGLVELATSDETAALTDATRAVTPDSLPLASASQQGLVELASNAEADAGTDGSRAMTPATTSRQLGAQVSSAEVAAGTETGIRRYSPADIVAIVLAHEAEGLTQAEVDARVRALVIDLALQGNSGRWPKGRLPADLVDTAALTAAVADFVPSNTITTERTAAITAAINALSFVTDGGEWAAGTAYAAQTIVRHEGATYLSNVAVLANTAATTEPGVGTAWEDSWDRLGYEDGPPNALVNVTRDERVLTFTRESGQNPLNVELPREAGGYTFYQQFDSTSTPAFMPTSVMTDTEIAAGEFYEEVLLETTAPGLNPGQPIAIDYEGALHIGQSEGRRIIDTAIGYTLFDGIPEKQFTSWRDVFAEARSDTELLIPADSFSNHGVIDVGTILLRDDGNGTYTLTESDFEQDIPVKVTLRIGLFNQHPVPRINTGGTLSFFSWDLAQLVAYQIGGIGGRSLTRGERLYVSSNLGDLTAEQRADLTDPTDPEPRSLDALTWTKTTENPDYDDPEGHVLVGPVSLSKSNVIGWWFIGEQYDALGNTVREYSKVLSPQGANDIHPSLVYVGPVGTSGAVLSISEIRNAQTLRVNFVPSSNESTSDPSLGSVAHAFPSRSRIVVYEAIAGGQKGEKGDSGVSVFRPVDLGTATFDLTGAATQVALLDAMSQPIVCPNNGYILAIVNAPTLGVVGSLSWMLAADLRDADADDALVAGLYTNSLNQIFFQAGAQDGGASTGNEIIIQHIGTTTDETGDDTVILPSIARFDVTGDAHPAAGSIAGGHYSYTLAISQSGHVNVARIVGFAGTAVHPNAVAVLHTVTDYHMESGTVTIPAGTTLAAEGDAYTLRLEVYPVGTEVSDAPTIYHDYRITARAPAGEVHFGATRYFAADTTVAQRAARIVFADDDITTTGDAAGDWTFSGIPANGNEYIPYWAVPASLAQPIHWVTSNIDITNFVESAAQRTIGGVDYNIYMYQADSRADDSANGSTVTTRTS